MLAAHGGCMDATAAQQLAHPEDSESDSAPLVDALVPVWAWQEAEKRVERANRRLARAGITERFTYTWGPVVVRRHEDGHDYRCRPLHLSAPSIAYDGWRMVAVLDAAPAGVVARTVPGEDLGGWRPDNLVCDHCGTTRARRATYVVRHDDGTVRQVGSNCLEAFLGLKPALWALGYQVSKNDEDWGGPLVGHSVHPASRVISLALALSRGGTAWVSKATADEHHRPTSSLVGNHIVDPAHTEQQRAERAAVEQAAQGFIDDGTVQDVIDTVMSLDEPGDFVVNLQTLLEGEWVDYRHIGITAAAVTAWNRAKRAETARAAGPVRVSGWYAPVGAKVADVAATVTNVTGWANDYNAWVTLVCMLTDTGHTLVWRTSSHVPDEVERGVRVRISGTVKANDTYQGTDQTRLVRCKVIPETTPSEKA